MLSISSPFCIYNILIIDETFNCKPLIPIGLHNQCGYKRFLLYIHIAYVYIYKLQSYNIIVSNGA